MSNACPQCGAENRPNAKFCQRCAHQLVALPSIADELKRRKRRRRSRLKAKSDAAEAPRTRRAGTPLWIISGLAALGLLAALWLVIPRPPAAVPAASSSPPAPTALATESRADAVIAPAQSASAAPSAVEPASAAVRLPDADALAPVRQAAALTARSTAGAGAAHEAPNDRHASPGVRDSRRAEPRKPSPPPRARPARDPIGSPDSRVAVAPVAPAPAPVRAPIAPIRQPVAPDTLCGNRTFLARDVCLQHECEKPSRRSHPQCARMRDLQESMRRGTGG